MKLSIDKQTSKFGQELHELVWNTFNISSPACKALIMYAGLLGRMPQMNVPILFLSMCPVSANPKPKTSSFFRITSTISPGSAWKFSIRLILSSTSSCSSSELPDDWNNAKYYIKIWNFYRYFCQWRLLLSFYSAKILATWLTTVKAWKKAW